MRMTLLIFMLVANLAQATTARTVFLENEDMGVVRLQGGKATVLSFPTKPEKVICGNKRPQ